jgi:hypothetical protein
LTHSLGKELKDMGQRLLDAVDGDLNHG